MWLVRKLFFSSVSGCSMEKATECPAEILEEELLEDQLTWMDPTQIKFSQSSISPIFRKSVALLKKANGASSTTTYAEALKAIAEESLEGLLQKLRSGLVKVDDIPPIRVVRHGDAWYSLDNRRLWVFREYGQQIPVLAVDCLKEFFKKRDPKSDGESITFLNSESASEFRHQQTLTSEVLKWSLENIQNDRLLANQVGKIPLQFSSLKKYLQCYVWPLIEEVRATLQQSIERIQDCPCAVLKGLEERDGNMEMTSFRNFRFEVERKANFKPMDIVLLATVAPTCTRDLQHPGQHYTLALLNGQSRAENGIDADYMMFRAKVYSPVESPEYKALTEGNRVWYIICLNSLATASRVWNALHWPLTTEKCQFRIFHEVLQAKTAITAHNYKAEGEIEGSQLKCAQWFNLNDSQMRALSRTVVGLEKEQQPYVRLIQGPPGTGKTSILVAMLSVLSSSGHRILMCAPTNVAISEVVNRFLKVVEHESGAFADSTKAIHSGDIVLVGNEERLAVDGPLSTVFLPHRVRRLGTVLSAYCGWKQKVHSMMDFLRSADEMFEQYKACEVVDENEIGGKKPTLSFLQFARDKMELLGAQMVDSLEIVCSDLPSVFLESTAILGAKDVISKVIALMRVDVSESSARGWFKHLESPGFGIAGDLQVLLRLLERNLNFVLYPAGKIEESELLKHASVVCCTVSSAGRHIVQQSIPPFDVAIIDEASQVVEAESAIVMGISGLKQLVLVGDQHQLPSTVISKVAQDAGYGTSLFKRLQTLDHPSIMLNVQYRMHPSMSRFSSYQFYGGELQDGPNVISDSYDEVSRSLLYGPYTFINVEDGIEISDEGHSKKNPVEVKIVFYLLSKLKKDHVRRKNGGLKVGIISPYDGQVEAIRTRLESTDLESMQVEVKSVDGFQGRETDVIILSAVRSNQRGNIGFLEDYRRLNVAITRARYCLCILGNAGTLAMNDGVWKDLIHDARNRECFMDPGRDPGMTKVIKKAKAELQQLEDLLNPKSVLFNNTLWKVLFSKEFKINFTRIPRKATKQHILNSILNLAKGMRAKHKFQPSVPICEDIEIHPTSRLYIVWTVDVEKDAGFQVLRVWDVANQQGLPVIIRRLENLFSTYSSAYLQRCRTKLTDRDGKVVIPAKWKTEDGFVWYKCISGKMQVNRNSQSDDDLELTTGEESNVAESLLLMKFYSLSSGVAWQLLTANDGSDIELPFEVTEQEARVIRNPLSSFIVGRSGTGKTTVITIKLLRREQQFGLSVRGLNADASDGISAAAQSKAFLRQALITVSSKLCAAIKHHLEKIRRSLLQTGSDETYEAEALMLDDEAEEELLSAVPNNLIDIPSKAFPLVITYRKFLAMLDGSVATPFLASETGRRLPQVLAAPATDEQHLNDEVFTTVDLPQHVDECETDSFDEEDWASEEDALASENDDMEVGPDFAGTSQESSAALRAREVDFNCFNSYYWPHFNASLTRKFDISLVYIEIMSHIKGSLESLQSSRGRISRDCYMNMASKRTSILDECQRENIYNLYVQYEKLKAKNGDYDLADYVWHLYQQLKAGGFRGTKLDFIYVDEVQDLTLAQISLLKFVTANMEEGFVFAGDTAQTIAKGINFRFEDIRSLFYTEFLGIDGATGSADEQSNGKKVKCTPKLHQLSQNFRTHRGIIKLADCIMNLILHFFPETVDKLMPEDSLICGEKPVILEAEEDNNLITSLFGQGGNIGGAECEFGAEQVILVRNSSKKQRLLEQLGKRSLILTIEECKGLEFQDVLLYNFFSDSSPSNKWRVLYNYLQEKNVLNGCKESFPKFDNKFHNLLCNELKQLYVAITRSKQRLWIYDENLDPQKPMLDCWNALELVHVIKLDDSLIASIHRISSPEQWKERGIQMFNEKQYDMATLCFERAGDLYRAQLSEAAGFQQDGEKRLGVDRNAAAQLLTKAANVYISLEKFEAAARCFRKIGNFKRAGVLYRDSVKLEEAGDCFMDAKSYEDAAEAYGSAGCVPKCLNACRHGKLLEKGLRFVEQWKNKKVQEKNSWGHSIIVDEDMEKLILDYLKQSAEHYHKKGETTSMMKFVHRFPNIMLKRKFLKRGDYFDELIQVESIAQNYKIASEVAEGKGDLKVAADLLEKAGEHAEGASKIIKHIRLQALWGNDNKGWPLRPYDDPILLKRAEILAAEDPKRKHELKVLRASSCDARELMDNWKLAKDDPNIEIIALHQLLDGSIMALKSYGIASPLNFDLELIHSTLDIDVYHERNPLRLLVFIWNTWFKKISSLVKALGKLQRIIPQGDPLLDSCLQYLGVSRQNLPGMCTVEDSEAFWLKRDGVSPLANQGKRGQLKTERLLLLAKGFWRGQLISTGLDCVAALEEYVCNAGVADQCKIIVKILDVLSELLTFENSERLTAKLRSYRMELYNLMFLRKTESTFEICALRDDANVTLHFDKLAVELMEMGSALSTREAAVLQILLPFLSKSWMSTPQQRVQPVTTALVRDLSTWIWFYSNSQQLRACDYFVSPIINFFEGVKDAFWNVSGDYIDPSAFLYLAERAVVMGYACLSHVTDLIVPRSFALEFMTGKTQEMLYTMMLQMGCSPQRTCLCLQGSLATIVEICKFLLTRGNDLEDWLQTSGLASELPRTVFRIVRILLTIFMDHANTDVNRIIFKNLKFLAAERSPILDVLPADFKRELQGALTLYRVSDGHLRRVFSKAMASVSDPFVVLRRKTRWRFGRTFMPVVDVEPQPWTFSLSWLQCLESEFLSNSGSPQHAEVVGDNIEEDSTIENTREDLTYECPELETEVEAELPPWYVKVGDSKLCWFVVWRILNRLRLVREKLQEDEYVREAKATFIRMACGDSEYVNTFLTEVCPLKASLDDFLANVSSAIQILKEQKAGDEDNLLKAKRDELLEKMIHFQDESEPLAELLDSRHQGHQRLDLGWLQAEVITRAKHRLEEGKKRLGVHLKELLGETLSSEEMIVSENAAETSNSKGSSKHKKKQQNKKKKKKR